MKVAILDLGMGNLHSVAKALAVAGGDVEVTEDPHGIGAFDGLCVPGQGIFGLFMDRLSVAGGASVVRDWIASGKSFLGICLGMQVLFDASDETAGTASAPERGLGVLAGKVTRLPPSVTVPHMGWNVVSNDNGLREYYYFDHSYAVHPADDTIVHGWCEHGDRFAAWIADGAVTAMQFHPEKSGRAGLDVLSDWVSA